MRNLNVQVGERIRLLRKNRNLTQHELGEKVQLPQTYIGAIERGEKNISLDTLERITNALHVAPEEVLDSNMNPSEKDKLVDKIKLLLMERDVKEVQLVHNLINDLLKVFDSK